MVFTISGFKPLMNRVHCFVFTPDGKRYGNIASLFNWATNVMVTLLLLSIEQGMLW